MHERQRGPTSGGRTSGGRQAAAAHSGVGGSTAEARHCLPTSPFPPGDPECCERLQQGLHNSLPAFAHLHLHRVADQNAGNEQHALIDSLRLGPVLNRRLGSSARRGWLGGGWRGGSGGACGSQSGTLAAPGTSWGCHGVRARQEVAAASTGGTWAPKAATALVSDTTAPAGDQCEEQQCTGPSRSSSSALPHSFCAGHLIAGSSLWESRLAHL